MEPGRIALPGRDPVLIASPSRHALEGAGFEIAERREPSFLFHGALLVTGEVDRTTPFEQGLAPSHQACRDGVWQPDQLVLDDQALVANVRGKGLVVLTGCGHAGIINTLRFVTKVAGGERLHAVVGGFHLGGPRFEPLIDPTCDAFAESRPRLPRSHALHRVEGDPRAGGAVPRCVRAEQRRYSLGARGHSPKLGRRARSARLDRFTDDRGDRAGARARRDGRCAAAGAAVVLTAIERMAGAAAGTAGALGLPLAARLGRLLD